MTRSPATLRSHTEYRGQYGGGAFAAGKAETGLLAIFRPAQPPTRRHGGRVAERRHAGWAPRAEVVSATGTRDAAEAAKTASLRTNGVGILRLVAVAWLALLCAVASHAEKRVALVIGNSAYRKVGRVPNPVSDAAAMAALFKDAGFIVSGTA